MARRLEMGNAATGLTHKMRQHFPGPFKVRDHSIQQWRDHRNIAGLPAVHLLRLLPNREHLTGDGANCNQRRLVHDHASPAHHDDGGPDPMSMAMESETRLRKASSPVNAAVLLISDIWLKDSLSDVDESVNFLVRDFDLPSPLGVRGEGAQPKPAQQVHNYSRTLVALQQDNVRNKPAMRKRQLPRVP